MRATDEREHALPSGQWLVEQSRSSVKFSIKHMLVAKVRGSFGEFEGQVSLGLGGAHAEGTVTVASIDTGDAVRDEHLRRSPDFFDVERYPRIQFSSTRIESLGHNRLRIVGELSMRGVTREIELSARIVADAPIDDDPAGRIMLELRGELDRGDFGLSWNQTLDTGGVLLGNKVGLALSVSADRGGPSRGPLLPGVLAHRD